MTDPTHTPRCMRQPGPRGFTLIELMVVMAIIALLAALAMPRYFHSVDRGKDAVLRQDLRAMREAIDQFQADRGRWPGSLDELVEARYLRALPVDPVTGSPATWVPVAPPADAAGPAGGVADVRSGAQGQGLDGTPYERW